MWLIALICATSLLIFVLIHTIKEHDSLIKYTIKRLPFNLIPFLISMFTIVLCLNYQGVIGKIASLFIKLSSNKYDTSLSYLISSTISCNLINNIPMTILFSNIINCANPLYLNNAIYATIIGSNIFNILLIIGVSAFITPITYNFSYNFDFSVLIVSSIILAIFPFIPPKDKMSRFNGIVYLFIYVAYLTILFVK